MIVFEALMMYSPCFFSLKAICCSNFVRSSLFVDFHSALVSFSHNSSSSRIDSFSSFIDLLRLASSIGSALSYWSSKSISSSSNEAIFYMLYNIMPESLYPQLPTAPPISQESFNIEMVRKYYQDIANLKEKYNGKQRNIRMLTIEYYMHLQVQVLLV